MNKSHWMAACIGVAALAVSAQASALERARWGGHSLGDTFAGSDYGACRISVGKTVPTDEFHLPSLAREVTAYCEEPSAGKEKTIYYFVGDLFLDDNRDAPDAARLYAIAHFFEDDGNGTRTRAYIEKLEQNGAVNSYMGWNEAFNCTVWRFGKDIEKTVDMGIIRYLRHPDAEKDYAQATLFLYAINSSEGVGVNFQHLQTLCKRTPFLKWDDVAK